MQDVVQASKETPNNDDDDGRNEVLIKCKYLFKIEFRQYMGYCGWHDDGMSEGGTVSLLF